jgi:ABC-type sugar transport system ATPase subunit
VPIAEQALDNYPGLRGSNGRKVIVGLRAGDLHPQGQGELPTIKARVQLVESLGGESMAYFKVDARSLKSEAGAEEEALESESEETVVGARPNLVASFPPHIQLQLGTEVPVGIDTRNLHFFDEATGAPLR